ncbi:MAG: peptidylprolyl isomerase [Betaproteobacteria bacterium]|nr:peptidylprolyl isomerase [Betaproteobacteria bacterium]
MNRALFRCSLVALAAALSVVSAFAKEDAAKPASIASVNGKPIPKIRADALVAAQTAQGQPDSDDLRKAVREELVRREIISQEAQKKGLDKKANIQGQMDLARQSVLINAYLGEYLRTHPVSEDALKKEYENIKLQLGDKEFKARHILVEKEDDARDIIAKLRKGEKFEDLAKQSKDPGSKDRGGDLGWAAPSSYVKPFSEAMMKLERGKFTETPVKTDFGFHVILLEDSRELKLPAMDEAKPQLAQRLQQQMVEKHVMELLGKSKVE